jgi:hypothetical protein
MVANLKGAIEVLKTRIHFNLKLIHENEEEIKLILKEPVSDHRSEKLKNRFNYNKKLIKENEEAIHIQRGIIHYLENYQNELSQLPEIVKFNNSNNKKPVEVNTKIEIKREDYYELTVNKAIEYNILHPYFKDHDFAKDLLSHFIKVEDYEMCARLSKLSKEKI